MKKIIIIVSTLISFISIEAKILKAEPVEPVKIITLNDVEIKKVKDEIKKYNQSQEDFLVKYEDIYYVPEKRLFKISNLKLHSKKTKEALPIRLGDALFSSLDDKRNIKLIMNNIRITKNEIFEISKHSGEELDEEAKQAIKSVFMLAGVEELVLKLNIHSKASEEEQSIIFDQQLEIEDFGSLSFLVRLNDVDKILFAENLNLENLTKEEEEKALEMKIVDFEFNIETLFSLGKLRAMIDENNYKEVINNQIIETSKNEDKLKYEKEVEIEILKAIRDNKNVVVKFGIGKDFTIMEGFQSFMMAIMNPEMAINSFEVYVEAKNK